MLLFRLALRKYAEDISGEGAKQAGGRWNPVGYPLHYTSTTAALAVLETLLHVDPDDLPPVILVTYRIPDEKVVPYEGPLPKHWQHIPAPARLAEIGRQWLESHSSLALRVPSVLLPHGPDANVLVNPQHPDLVTLTIEQSQPFSFDPRLVEKRLR